MAYFLRNLLHLFAYLIYKWNKSYCSKLKRVDLNPVNYIYIAKTKNIRLKIFSTVR